MRTTGQLIAAMLQRLGKSPSSSTREYDGRTYDVSVDLVALLNDAGRELLSARPWSWLEKDTTITTAAGVVSYDLPANTLSLESIGVAGGGSCAVTLVPFEAIRDARNLTSYNETPFGFIAALGGGVQRTAGLPLVRTLEIDPAPGDTATTLTVSLKRGWVDLTAENPDQVPAIPPHWDRAIYLAARRMAWKDQNVGTASPDEAEYMAEIDRLWDIDENEQPEQGLIQGGLDRTPSERYGAGIDLTTVQFP